MAFMSTFFVLVFIDLVKCLICFSTVGDRSFVGDPCGAHRSAFSSQMMHKDVRSSSNRILTRAGICRSKARREACPFSGVFTRTMKCSAGNGDNLRSRTGFRLLASRSFFLRRVGGRFLKGGGRNSAIVSDLGTSLRAAMCGSLKSQEKTMIMLRPSAKHVLTVIDGPSFSPGAVTRG